MTLPTSGVISLSMINTELGRASNAAISLNEAAVRALAGKPSGIISLSDFYGKSALSLGFSPSNFGLGTRFFYGTTPWWTFNPDGSITIPADTFCDPQISAYLTPLTSNAGAAFEIQITAGSGSPAFTLGGVSVGSGVTSAWMSLATAKTLIAVSDGYGTLRIRNATTLAQISMSFNVTAF